VTAAAPEAGHDAHDLVREAGVDLRQDRLKDTLGAVHAGFEVIFGPLFYLGDKFFRGHPNLLNPESL
jgi:hypothetical protein